LHGFKGSPDQRFTFNAAHIRVGFKIKQNFALTFSRVSAKDRPKLNQRLLTHDRVKFARGISGFWVNPGEASGPTPGLSAWAGISLRTKR
jgi:hypothetical protein